MSQRISLHSQALYDYIKTRVELKVLSLWNMWVSLWISTITLFSYFEIFFNETNIDDVDHMLHYHWFLWNPNFRHWWCFMVMGQNTTCVDYVWSSWNIFVHLHHTVLSISVLFCETRKENIVGCIGIWKWMFGLWRWKWVRCHYCRHFGRNFNSDMEISWLRFEKTV